MPGSILVGSLILAWFCYAPGIGGSFIFDDFINIARIEELGGIDSFDKAIRFALITSHDFSGRPVSYASFLLDDNGWPSSPRPFKTTNILLHLVCGLLLAWLGLRISLAQGVSTRTAAWIAVAAASLWLLHPLHVSTVLYAVQRMAILAALFVLAGLLVYVIGRLNLAQGNTRRAFVQMSLGIGFFTPLAFFSKENGALLPLLALTLDATVLQKLHVPPASQRPFQVWRAVFLFAPLAAMAIYFISSWSNGISRGYLGRPFTLEERLLTEPRVLWDYLFNLFIPKIQTNGLYYDNYPVSTGLLEPLTTLPALAGIIGLIVAAVWLRKRYPVLALAVVFFLAGHVLESTFLPLELYFEHRNYLPSTMLFLAAGYYLVTGLSARAAVAVALVAVTLLSTFAYAWSTLWSDVDTLALVWAKRNPGSLRSQQQAAIAWLNRGEPERAEQHIQTAIEHHPHRSSLRIQYLGLRCATGRLTPQDVRAAAEVLRNGIYESSLHLNLERLIDLYQDGRCPRLKAEDIETLLAAALANPVTRHFPGFRQEIYYLSGRFALLTGATDRAVLALKDAFDVRPDIEVGLSATALLASHGHYKKALEMLDKSEALLHRSHGDRPLRAALGQRLRNYGYEIERLRGTILADLKRSGDTK